MPEPSQELRDGPPTPEDPAPHVSTVERLCQDYLLTCHQLDSDTKDDWDQAKASAEKDWEETKGKLEDTADEAGKKINRAANEAEKKARELKKRAKVSRGGAR